MKIKKTVGVDTRTVDEGGEKQLSWDEFQDAVSVMHREIFSPEEQPNIEPIVRVSGTWFIVEWEEEVDV